MRGLGWRRQERGVLAINPCVWDSGGYVFILHKGGPLVCDIEMADSQIDSP